MRMSPSNDPMEMNHHRPRRDRIRSAVLGDLARAREAFLDAARGDRPNVFVWHGEAFWIDRARTLVLPALDVAAWRDATTLPDDGELGDATNLVEVFGGAARLLTSGEILQLFVGFLRGKHESCLWRHTAAHILNLAVVQPSIAPAFGALFWLALAYDLGPSGPRDNFYDLVGPMLVDLATPTELRRDPTKTREAQIALIEAIEPGRASPRARELSGADWTRFCEDVLESHRQLVDNWVFDGIWSRAGELDL